MNITDFDFDLPEELIAQEPCPDRDHSRLMVLDRGGKAIEHRLFLEIIEYFRPGDLLVINDTRVIPAMLVGKKQTGGRIEVFLLERTPGKGDVWECLIGGKRARPGLTMEFDEVLKGQIIEDLGDGRFRVLFHCNMPFEDILEKLGQVPLPPYIKRPPLPHPRGGREWVGVDKERYQTVFAEKKGAVAAPTAGLHFTEALLERVKGKGVEVVPVTLHVGPGTFLPVRTERIEEHRMLPERYEITHDAEERINRAKKEGRRVIAVGTTVTRTLEASATPLEKGGGWGIKAGVDKTSIFIYPGYAFKVVDSLVTNFHLPRSTLLMLVAAFAGRDFIFKAYREAVDKGYRFYSYGDAMMIL